MASSRPFLYKIRLIEEGPHKGGLSSLQYIHEVDSRGFSIRYYPIILNISPEDITYRKRDALKSPVACTFDSTFMASPSLKAAVTSMGDKLASQYSTIVMGF